MTAAHKTQYKAVLLLLPPQHYCPAMPFAITLCNFQCDHPLAITSCNHPFAIILLRSPFALSSAHIKSNPCLNQHYPKPHLSAVPAPLLLQLPQHRCPAPFPLLPPLPLTPAEPRCGHEPKQARLVVVVGEWSDQPMRACMCIFV